MRVKATFLNAEHLWWGGLPMFKKIGLQFKVSDAARVEGCWMRGEEYTSIWVDASTADGYVYTIDCDGERSWSSPSLKSQGALPALLSSSNLSLIRPRDMELSFDIPNRNITVVGSKKGVPIVTIGLECPQTIASKAISASLNVALSEGKLQATNRQYTHNGSKRQEYVFLNEATGQNETYIKSVVELYGDRCYEFPNGRNIEKGNSIWLKVEPIKYYWEKKGEYKGTLVPTRVLYSGQPFDKDQQRYSDKNGFGRTTISEYNNMFMREAQQVLNVQVAPGASPIRQDDTQAVKRKTAPTPA